MIRWGKDIGGGRSGRGWMRATFGASTAILALALAPSPAFAKCAVRQIAELKVFMDGDQPMIDTKVNGRDARFIADSGAFFSTISPGSAAALGLKLSSAPPGFYMTGIGGSATVQVATVKEFTLAGIPLHNVQFLVGGSEVGGAGLLGQNVLGLADVEYDLAHGAIRLLKPKDCDSKTGLAYWAGTRPFSMIAINERSPLAPHTIGTVTINGVKMRAMFDTGADSTILSLSAAARAGVKPDSPGVEHAGFSRGLGRKIMQTWIAPFASVKIGEGEEIRRTKLQIGQMDLGDADLLIGADFFLSHRVYVANSQRRLYFTYDGGPVFNITPNRVVGADGSAATLPVEDADQPKDAEGFARRGAAFASRQETDKAIADFSKAIDMAPTEPRYRYQRALARLAKKQPALAMDDLDRAIALNGDFVDARLARASLRLERHDRSAAVEDIDTVSRLEAPSADNRLMLASFYSSIDDFDRSIGQYDLWIKAHPVDSRRAAALNGRCWARALAGRDLAAALDDCNGALKLRPGNPAMLDSRGLVHLRLGNTDKAIADYNAVLAVDPKIAWSLMGRGLAERRKGLTAKGDEDVKAAIAIDPELPARAKALGVTQ